MTNDSNFEVKVLKSRLNIKYKCKGVVIALQTLDEDAGLNAACSIVLGSI